MTDIRNIALGKAVQLLVAAKAQYKIIAEDGTEYGDLVLAAPEAPKRTSNRPTRSDFGLRHGELSAYVSQFIDNLAVGDDVTVAPGGYPLPLIARACSSRAGRLWGSGSAITTTDKASNRVQLLRVA